MADYGVDFSCTSDLEDELRVISGPLVLAQALVRRWSTPRGMLIDDPDYGTDLRENINESVDNLALIRIRSECRAEALKDERVVDCVITASRYDQGTGVVTLMITIEAREESITMVLAVSDLTVDLLTIG